MSEPMRSSGLTLSTGEEEDLSDDDKLLEAQPLGSYVLQDSNRR